MLDINDDAGNGQYTYLKRLFTNFKSITSFVHPKKGNNSCMRNEDRETHGGFMWGLFVRKAYQILSSVSKNSP